MFGLPRILFGIVAITGLLVHVDADKTSLIGLSIVSTQTIGGVPQLPETHTFASSPASAAVFTTTFGSFVSVDDGTPSPSNFVLHFTGELSIDYHAKSKSTANGATQIAITGPGATHPVFTGFETRNPEGDVDNTGADALSAADLADILLHVPEQSVLPDGSVVLRTSDHQDVDADGVFDSKFDVTYNFQLFNGPPPVCTGACCNGGSACGDPQFTGFVGQSYQIHGVANTVYNIITSPTLQVNALFTYLESGKCRKGTQCFAHPGNYFGEMGLLFADEAGSVTRVHVHSGPVDVGMRITVNDVDVEPSQTPIKVGTSSITFSNAFQVDLLTPEFSVRLTNSDMFLNEEVSINMPLLQKIQRFKQLAKSNSTEQAASLLQQLPHGLLGQTWQPKTYNNRWRYIQGTLFDYMSTDVFGTSFEYNRFAF